MPADTNMADVKPDRALMALLALDADEPRSPAVKNRAPNLQSLPSLDERVDLFLRAVHGPNHKFTAQQRTSARNRILNAMAADLAGEIDDAGLHDGRIAASTLTATRTTSDMAGSVGRAVRSFGSLLRDALLLPLMMPMLASGRMRMVTASLMTLLVAGAGWSATWFYAARSAETAIASWIDGEAKSGRTYDCGSRTVSGFPLRVEMHCIDPKATLALGPSTLVVNAKELRATASLLQPDALTTEITGPLSVAGSDKSAQYVGNWTLAQTVLHGLSPNPKQISFVVDGLQFYRVSQNNMEPVLAGDRLELAARRNSTSTAGTSAFDITANVVGGSIPGGGSIASQPFAADISAVLHDVATTTPKALIARLQEWQSGGGRLEVTTARIQQGEAVATAAGNIGLSNTGRIEGALRVATIGPYQQLAQSYIRDGQRGTAERERLAQSFLGGARVQSRSIDNTQRTERDLQREAAEREARLAAERQRQQATATQQSNTNANVPARPNAANLQPGTSSDVPIRFVDGAVYLGSVELFKVPPLF